jgi:hypothetical protein
MTATDGDLNFMKSRPRPTPVERETGPRPASAPISEVTVSDRWWWRLRDYFTLPDLLTDRAASVPELAAYAHRGGWTRQPFGPVRNAGIWWWRLVGLPQTLRCRVREWVWQRPGRALTVVLLVKLLSLTAPGAYVVEQLIEPVVHAALWLFL